MRIAAALPSLETSSPTRRTLDETLATLARGGHDVEAFVEHDRLADDLAVPQYHYLRQPERHAERAFDVALYPLGRDGRPYQGVYALMKVCPGVVWYLDPIVHHLAVGGIALMSDWAGYRRLLDEAYGPTGAAVAHTVAYNWGTGALYRRYDLIAATAAGQRGVLAAWPALAERVASRLDTDEVTVVPLGISPDDAAAAAQGNQPGSGSSIISIMTVNESYATTAVRAAAAALEVVPGASVRICLSEPIYKAEGSKVARHLGVHDRIDWRLTSSPAELAATASASDTLVWLAEELQATHRQLLVRGLAQRKVTFVPRSPLYEDLPAGAVVKLERGTRLPLDFAALLRGLDQDAELRAGLLDCGAAYHDGCATVDDAVAVLVAELERFADEGPPRPADVSAPAWDKVAGRLRDAALPAGASAATTELINRIIRDQLATFHR